MLADDRPDRQDAGHPLPARIATAARHAGGLPFRVATVLVRVLLLLPIFGLDAGLVIQGEASPECGWWYLDDPEFLTTFFPWPALLAGLTASVLTVTLRSAVLCLGRGEVRVSRRWLGLDAFLLVFWLWTINPLGVALHAGQTPMPRDPGSVLMALSVTGWFSATEGSGHPPAVMTATIRGDGRVSESPTVEGRGFAWSEGTYAVPREQVLLLLQRFRQVDYFALKESYVCPRVHRDWSGFTRLSTTLTIDGRTKSVVRNEDFGPAKLKGVELEMLAVLNAHSANPIWGTVRRWVKPR